MLGDFGLPLDVLDVYADQMAFIRAVREACLAAYSEKAVNALHSVVEMSSCDY